MPAAALPRTGHVCEQTRVPDVCPQGLTPYPPRWAARPVTEGHGSSSHTEVLCVCARGAAPLWASVSSSSSDSAGGSASALPPPPYLSQVSVSGKLSTRRKLRLRNLSSLVAEGMLHDELRSSLSAWLRLPRLLDGEASTGWLGKTAACFRCSCRDGLEEPSARGCGSRRGTRL